MVHTRIAYCLLDIPWCGVAAWSFLGHRRLVLAAKFAADNISQHVHMMAHASLEADRHHLGSTLMPSNLELFNLLINVPGDTESRRTSMLDLLADCSPA